MSRPRRDWSLLDECWVDSSIKALQAARKGARLARCPQLLKKIDSALASANGAKRHLELRKIRRAA